MESMHKTQIIDYDGNIMEDLNEWMKKNNLANLGFNYNVIAILGSQSSGKSTLLNNLFKTSFDVMNTKLGHSQTTQGLWLSYDKFEENTVNATNDQVEDVNNVNKVIKKGKQLKGEKEGVNPTLILDVEGNDSKERGDNRLTFEHRSALFSLALADCVIVNLWYHSLGNFTASNYGLLKTVMEVNLELFQQDKNCPKTILLFTVRDWFEDFASIDIVKSKIEEEYINKIWKEMKKPVEVEHMNINNYFIIEVVGLSHGIIKKDEFLNDVHNLRQKWINELRPLQYSRNIPSDGFAQYCNNIWNTIVKQSQLDIPSQKEMLATFRCQEIKNTVINSISKIIKEKLNDSHEKPINNFKEWAEKEIIQKSLSEYMIDASRYNENICTKTLEELLENLFIQLQIIVDNNLNFTQRILSGKFSNELSNLYSPCSTDKSPFSFGKESNLVFKKEEQESLPKLGRSEKNKQEKCISLWSNFLLNADKLEYSTLCNFFQDYEKCTIEITDSKKIHEFNYKPSLSILTTAICKDVNRIRNIQYTVLLDRTRATVKCRFKSVDTLLLTTKSAEEYWEHIQNIVKKVQENINGNLSKCFANLKGDTINESSHSRGTIVDTERDRTIYEGDAGDGNNCFRYDDRILHSTSKVAMIRKKGKYISKVNDEIEKQMKDKKFSSQLSSYYLDEIMDVLKNKLDEISENLSSIIIQRFESVFNYDDAEQPRQWRDISAVELKRIFRESKNYAFLIIDILQKNVKVELIDDYLPNNFIKDEIIEKGKNKAKRKIQEICRDAQYIQETGVKMSLKNVPLIFWVILLILGWNEILLFTRIFFRLNILLPFLFAFVLIVCTFVYNGNAQILSIINKVIFSMAKNSYGFYRHIQTISNKTAKVQPSN
ncbi:protein SEY1, putative [Plasmodium ovale]|uniref:Protein SEY1 homolog n=2 Tax=Plasmodium ovale TaxID=36330 RepID=A0A1A8WZB4_PLAOA|nr:protein SEY1, putative (SEY1) [Plasmodium ovale curtisi]SBS97671.1 protein SEY1, putative (SEY1) [Plasmodium ovale curtisi]SCP06250.1 protein SEY1, putative [Plasmodium ovale]